MSSLKPRPARSAYLFRGVSIILPALVMLALASPARAQVLQAGSGFGDELCQSGPCSPFDDDNDGLADAFDVCPHKAETFNGFEDGDGCPDPDAAALDELSQRIFFDSGSARLSASSRPALAAVSRLLKSERAMTLGQVEILGHADHRGSEPYNQRLSGRRASAVRDWLQRSGVSASRLHSSAAGSLPGAEAETMRLNRRVELRVRAEQLRGVAHAEEVPQVEFPSHWRIRQVAQGTKVQILSVSDAVYSVYGIARRRNLWGIYGRSATGHEIDMLVNVLASGAIRVSCRLRGPSNHGGWTDGPILQQWNESTEPSNRTKPLQYAVPRVLASNQKAPGAIAVYGSTLFFAVDGAIMNMQKTGAAPTAVILGVNPRDLLVDGSDVYWAEGDRIRRAYKDGGNALTIAMKQKGPREITIYGNHIYWIDAGRDDSEQPTIRRAMRDGTEAKRLATAADPRGLVANASGVYWANARVGTIMHLPPNIETPITVVSGLKAPSDLAVDETHIYWVEDEGLFRIELSGGTPQKLSSTPGRRLAITQSHVYFIAGSGSNAVGDALMRVPKQGGHMGVIVSEGAAELAIDELNVYWTRLTGEGEGAILSISR